MDQAAQGVESLSSQGAWKGCLACLDGHLIQTKVPSISETSNVKESLLRNHF